MSTSKLRGTATRVLVTLAGLLMAACGGGSVHGARPWTDVHAPGGKKAQLVAAYQLAECSDVLGQEVPVTPERMTLYRAGTELQLVSETQGLTPLVLENRLHGDDGHTFQAILDGQLLEIQLPTEKRKGRWLLASHWEQWQQQRGFGARAVRVVERCELAALPQRTDETAFPLRESPPFGLANPPLPGYGMRPVHDEQRRAFEQDSRQESH